MAILEEPEHLNWYHHGRRWTDKFQHVVGIIHTNYLDYAAREEGGVAKAKAMAVANQIVCRMHCHKVGKGSRLSEHNNVTPCFWAYSSFERALMWLRGCRRW